MLTYPKKYIISSGAATGLYELIAFDSALIAAGISNYNLLRVSSILPIGCKQVKTLDKLPGSALLVAYGTLSSNTPGQTIASAVSVGIPEDTAQVGVIMEYSGVCDAATAEATVKEMAATAMANHGIACKEILSASSEITVPDEGYAATISAISMW